MAKFYALTRAGRKQLAEELDQWQRYARSIGWVLEA
jgi:DNA-binding PadR family transcriptional regulator